MSRTSRETSYWTLILKFVSPARLNPALHLALLGSLIWTTALAQTNLPRTEQSSLVINEQQFAHFANQSSTHCTLTSRGLRVCADEGATLACDRATLALNFESGAALPLSNVVFSPSVSRSTLIIRTRGDTRGVVLLPLPRASECNQNFRARVEQATNQLPLAQSLYPLLATTELNSRLNAEAGCAERETAPSCSSDPHTLRGYVQGLTTAATVEETLRTLRSCAQSEPTAFARALPCLQNALEWSQVLREDFAGFGAFATSQSLASVGSASYSEGAGLEFPEMMSMPSVLSQNPLASLIDQSTRSALPLTQLREALNAVNRNRPENRRILMTAFTSTFPSPGGGRGRLLFYVPGENFEQWIQFARPFPDNEQLAANNVSIVGIQTHTRRNLQARRVLERPLERLSDFTWRLNEQGRLVAAPRLIQSMANPLHGSRDCFMCHTSGTVAVSRDVATSFSESERREFAQMNRTLSRHSNIRLEFSGSLVDQLPIGGTVDRPRPDAFLQTCARGVNQDRYPALRQAMNCARCHDGSQLRALHPFDSNATIRTHIEGGSMPLGESPLPTGERSAIIRCLTQEYESQVRQWAETPQFRRWVENASCWQSLGQSNSRQAR